MSESYLVFRDPCRIISLIILFDSTIFNEFSILCLFTNRCNITAFLARLYESTGRTIAVNSALALALASALV